MNAVTMLAVVCPLALLAACTDPGADSRSGPVSESASTPTTGEGGREPIVGLPCEGCEAVFVGLPDDPPADVRIAPEDEPGEPLVLTGVVRDRTGEAVPGVIVYAYHTDAAGIYPRPAPDAEGAYRRHGTLRAWARADAEGRYTFRTIRPASYPDTDIPQHIHMHVIEPGRCTYYIADAMFEDDPKLTERMRSRTRQRGGRGVSMPMLGDDGVWRATRDITLGEHVPGYPERG